MSTPRYFCHTCKKDIVPIEELTCPTCNGEFVEEVEEDDPPPVAQPQPPPQAQQQNMGTAPELLPFAQLWRQMFPYMQNNNPFAPPVNINNNNTPNNTSNTSNTSNAPGAQSGQQGQQQQQQQQQQQRTFTFQSGPFQIHGVPSPFFHMHHTHANNNQQNPQMPQVFQFPMNNFPMNNFFEALSNIPGLNFNQPLAGNPGDYVFGPNFENILNQLFQNANHTGNPPASKSAIDELNKGEVNETHVENKADCAICKEEFALGSEYIEMPCKHIFDKECILQWLAIHNSCPVCRLELKTDNADYEARRQR